MLPPTLAWHYRATWKRRSGHVHVMSERKSNAKDQRKTTTFIDKMGWAIYANP